MLGARFVPTPCAHVLRCHVNPGVTQPPEAAAENTPGSPGRQSPGLSRPCSQPRAPALCEFTHRSPFGVCPALLDEWLSLHIPG